MICRLWTWLSLKRVSTTNIYIVYYFRPLQPLLWVGRVKPFRQCLRGFNNGHKISGCEIAKSVMANDFYFWRKLEGLSQIKRANRQINIRIERENGFCMKRKREREGGYTSWLSVHLLNITCYRYKILTLFTLYNYYYYYSFKIFPRFWLAKSTRIIHHN